MDSKTFAARLAKKSGCDIKTVSAVLAAFADVLRQRGADLDTVAVPALGNFVAMKHNETVTTDPVSGKRSLVPPRIVVEFVAGSMLKKRLSNE